MIKNIIVGLFLPFKRMKEIHEEQALKEIKASEKGVELCQGERCDLCGDVNFIPQDAGGCICSRCH